MKKTRLVSLALSILMLLTLVRCTAPQTREVTVPDRPAMWEVTNPETGGKIYLFGSIHVAEESLYPFDEEIMQAFSSTDFLAVEFDLLAFSEDAALQIELSEQMMYRDGRTITDEIDEAVINKAAKALVKAEMSPELPEEYMKRMRPYVWQSLLSEAATKKAALSSDHGVDRHFLALAREQKKEILEIESAESQLTLLNEVPPETVALLLEEASDVDRNGESTRRLYAIWKTGDTEALLAYAEGEGEGTYSEAELALLEAYNDKLVTQRNNLMADAADGYLQDGKTVFYVVGALHMVGEDGIVAQLIQRGYSVERA